MTIPLHSGIPARGAVCGTCAMLINRYPACVPDPARTVVGRKPGSRPFHYSLPDLTEPWDPRSEVIIEPLPHLPVIKDLIVDMTAFFAAYRAIARCSGRGSGPGEGTADEYGRSPRAGAVYSLHPLCCLLRRVPGQRQEFPLHGPAALAKLYRFRIDPREKQGTERLKTADHADGWWACEFHTNCRRVCPKDVPPDKAIGHARQELKAMKKERNGP